MIVNSCLQTQELGFHTGWANLAYVGKYLEGREPIGSVIWPPENFLGCGVGEPDTHLG